MGCLGSLRGKDLAKKKGVKRLADDGSLVLRRGVIFEKSNKINVPLEKDFRLIPFLTQWGKRLQL